MEWFFSSLFAVLGCLFVLGLWTASETCAKDDIAHHCDIYGKVELNKAVYECHKFLGETK